MKDAQRLAVILAAILMSAFLCHFSSLLASAQVDSQDLKQGVVKIIAEKPDNVKDTGAGIVIGVDKSTAFILTAYHVVAEAKRIEVFFFDKRYTRFLAEGFEEYNEDLDIVVIMVKSQEIPSNLPSFPLGDASKLREEKDTVKCIGHPGDYEWEPAKNTIQKLNYKGDFRKFRFTRVALDRGNSGGPVLNEEGSLIGMVTRLDSVNAHAVKIGAALEVLQQEWRVPTTKITRQVAAQPTSQPIPSTPAPTPATPPPTPPSPPKKPPPSAAPILTAAALQQTYKDPVTGMEFVLVKGGCFEMGDTFGDGDPNERPVHEVCVGDFYMGKYEVTVGQFRQFVQETGYQTEAERGDGAWYWTGSEVKTGKDINWKNPGFAQTDRHPVVCVSYHDVMAFAEWLGRKSGKTTRLPTEAEWEYAARSAGKKYKYSWGNGSPSANIADISAKKQLPKWPWPIWEGYDDGYVYTAPVGTYQPNELGLYDTTGNVWEWCADWYGEKYYGESPKENPQGPASGEKRVIRGGSWFNEPRAVRAANRDGIEPSYRDDVGGFRLVLPPQ